MKENLLEDDQTHNIGPEHPEKLRVPQPPKDPPKPRATTRTPVQGVKVALAPPHHHDLDYIGPGGPRFDAQGMILPHSILGSLEDFRREMETRGEKEFVKRIPDLTKQPPLQPQGQNCEQRTRSHPIYELDVQGHALQNWYCHMGERRRQQNFISQLLQKPVEDLLMNKSNQFRETQEQRELISRGLSALYHGYGSDVGSGFWSVPQHFGDELSGITATLTQTERGNTQPITHISQPQSTRFESGTVKSAGSVSSAWSRSQYLKKRQQELQSYLSDLDYNQPEMDGLEIVGSSLPFTSQSGECCPLLEDKEEEKTEEQNEKSEEQLELPDDLIEDENLLPALRIGDEVARWTGTTTSHQGEVCVCVRLTFETVVGENASTHLDLRNEGNTVIYYSWQKLNLKNSFPEIRTQRDTPNFYCNTNTGVLLPGDTHRIFFTFKSVYPGIMREVWQVNTHPVLMGGASLQVTLRGVALYQDDTADQRAALEAELEHRVAVCVCKSVVCELLRGVQTPEKVRSPDPLTEEEQFNIQNLNLHYHREPVEALKRLWERIKAPELEHTSEEHTRPVWDLSMSSLRRVVLSLPQQDADRHTASVYREEALNQYNTLILQLHQPQPSCSPLTSHSIGLQLWRELLDDLSTEALRLRHLLGLPESETWTETQGGKPNEETTERKVTRTNDRGTVREKEEQKAAARPRVKPAAQDKETELKLMEEKTGSERIEGPGVQHDLIDPQLYLRYTQSLHRQVYVLVEKLIDSLFELLDETQQVRDEPHKLY